MVTTAKRSRAASHDTGSLRTAEAVFQCPICGGALKRVASGALACQACHHEVSVAEGIIDFVAGAAVASLDNIDYDAFYGINASHSQELCQVLLRAAGARWPKDFGNALEIGCGTGGLSLALFSEIKADSVVPTDISPKMLRICRDRLQKAIPDRVKAFTFATYGGTERCYRAGMFEFLLWNRSRPPHRRRSAVPEAG
jgi:ribosomal protein L37AE/L43A